MKNNDDFHFTGGGLFPSLFCGGRVFIKFWDSRHIQVAIYTVVDEESEIQLKTKQNLEPGGEHRKNEFRKK